MTHYPQHGISKLDDLVNHPDHYTWHPHAECKDIAGEFNYNTGTAMAYIWRAGLKNSDTELEDLQKAIKHLEFECARLGASAQPSVAAPVSSYEQDDKYENSKSGFSTADY